MAITHEHAVEVDTKLAELWQRQQDATTAITAAVQSLHGSLGHKYRPARHGESPYAESADDTETEARDAVAQPRSGRHWWYDSDDDTLRPQPSVCYITEALAKLDEARATIRRTRAEAKPLEFLFAAERWPRFFLVLNTGGHIHRSMSCSTTFPTTQWAWLPELSGLGEDAAVEQQGPRLCSVCFPSAPVEWTLGLPAKVNPARCAGSGQQALGIVRRYHTPRGKCSVCGTGVAVSVTGLARPHNTPKGA